METAEETEGAARSVKCGLLGGAWDVPLLLCFVFCVCFFAVFIIPFNKS